LSHQQEKKKLFFLGATRFVKGPAKRDQERQRTQGQKERKPVASRFSAKGQKPQGIMGGGDKKKKQPGKCLRHWEKGKKGRSKLPENSE